MTTDTRTGPITVLILGAGGRDFHNFNTVFRDDPRYRVIAFTAAQIPGIAGRTYPAELAGPLYGDGIPIHDESEAEALVSRMGIDQVVFAYSDVSHDYVMDVASRMMASGADFRLLGPTSTMLPSSRPVIAVTAVRTGAGKSQTTRAVVQALRELGKAVAVIRHPMPYGDLAAQAVQRFAGYDDLARHEVTIEEREEYEPHIATGSVVFAGVDYGRILASAEAEAEVIVWDGGNNDLPFYRPDVHIVVVDPLRAGHEMIYYPSQVNLRMADVAIINKVDSATTAEIERVEASLAAANPDAEVMLAESRITVAEPKAITDRRVVVVEDGPTLTHGEMSFGAGFVAAKRFGASEVVDPRPYAVGSIAETYEEFPAIGSVLPAMGYGDAQIADLAETLSRVPADVVVVGTPIDLGRIVSLNKPAVRVRYDLRIVGQASIKATLQARLPSI